MRCSLTIVFLFCAVAASAQHFHRCTIYYQDREKYSIDTLNHLCLVQYFNDFGEIIREEEYGFLDNGDYKFDTACRGWTDYFYEKDTILLKSIYRRYRGSKKTIVDTCIDKFHYNQLGLLIVDSSFYCGWVTYQNYDLISGFIGCTREVHEFFYDAQGRKIKEIKTEFSHGGRHSFGSKKKQTFKYDENNRLAKMSASYIYNHENYNPRLPDVGDYIYKYSDGNLVELKQYHYTDRYNNPDTSISRETHTYISNNDQIIKEEIEFGWPESKKVIEYGYFPDKRKIKETRYGVTRSYTYE